MTTATDMLAKYLAAEQAILEGKEARLGDRTAHGGIIVAGLPTVLIGRNDGECIAQAACAGAAHFQSASGD